MLILPLIFFMLLSLLFFTVHPQGIRDSILKGFLGTFLLVLSSTELLSLLNSITRKWILITWLVAVILAAGLLLYYWKTKNHASLLGRLKNIMGAGTAPKLILVTCLIIILFVASLTFLIALKSPPNNYDSMTYHMARIPHWIQNQNIRYYPTSVPRQNYSMPVAEYAILHLQLLSKSDHYANLIQWSGFILSILTASLITKELQISQRGQWLVAALTSTLPMAILQSTSTQNDLVVGLFCLAFAYFLIKTIQGFLWKDAFMAALSLGLALGTKGTAYIFCAGIGIGVGIAGLSLTDKRWNRIKALSARFLVIIITAIILNTGIYVRNWQLYNHPLITSNERTMVDRLTPGIILANIARNSALHLASPLPAVNQLITTSTAALLGQEINNPDSTFQDSSFDISFAINEDDAGNGLHFLLLIAAIAVLPFLTSRKEKLLLYYLAVVFLSFQFFNLAFKWQPWGGRLQTAIFLLGCVLMGSLIDKLFSRNHLPALILVLFFIASIPYLLLNSIRPILPLWEDTSAFYDTEAERKFYSAAGQFLENFPALEKELNSFLSIFYDGRSVILTDRRELYFLGNFEPYYWYIEACHFVRNDPSREIGLIMDQNDWEYPIWVLLGQHASPGKLRINHIEVENVSAAIAHHQNTVPELILITRDEYKDLPLLADYEQVYSSRSIQIMKLSEVAPK